MKKLPRKLDPLGARGVLRIALLVVVSLCNGCAQQHHNVNQSHNITLFDEVHYPQLPLRTEDQKKAIITSFRNSIYPILGATKSIVHATGVQPESAVFYFLSCSLHTPPFMPVIRIVFPQGGGGALATNTTAENFIKIMSTVPGWRQGTLPHAAGIGGINAVVTSMAPSFPGGIIEVTGECNINSDPTGISDDDLKFEHEIEVRHPKEIRYLFIQSPTVPFFHS